jgi:hypothetical protein
MEEDKCGSNPRVAVVIVKDHTPGQCTASNLSIMLHPCKRFIKHLLEEGQCSAWQKLVLDEFHSSKDTKCKNIYF